MKKQKRKSNPSAGIRPIRMRDPELAQLSHELDASADRRWFESHPGAKVRRRAPTLLERGAFEIPPGVTVDVFRTSDGVQARIFVYDA